MIYTEAVEILKELATFDYVKLEKGDEAIEIILGNLDAMTDINKQQEREIEKTKEQAEYLRKCYANELERSRMYFLETEALKQELKKKDKIIDLMTNYICERDDCELRDEGRK